MTTPIMEQIPAPTSPSAVRRAAIKARIEAAGASPSIRGRPRRNILDAATYILSVRLTAEEERAAKAAASEAGMTLANWTRYAVTKKPIMTVKFVEVQSRLDAEYVRQLAAIGNLANQIARAWNHMEKSMATTPITARDVDEVRLAAERLNRLLDPLLAMDKSMTNRIAAAAKLALGIRPSL